MIRIPLETADFGLVTVFYQFHPAEEGPTVHAHVEIEKIVAIPRAAGCDITDALTTMFSDHWESLNKQLLERHVA